MQKTLLFSLLFISTFCNSQINVSQEILNHSESIDSNIIKAHVTYLADDKLLGRQPGKPGYQMAVDYVVDQFKKLGLKPQGENKGYLQKVILRNTKLLKDKSSVIVAFPSGITQNIALVEDMNLYPHPEKKSIDISAPLVFIGAGFDAPKLGFSDYKNIDVKNKIVVIMRKIPENISENVKRHLTYSSTYQEFAAKNGAIGMIICNYTLTPTQFKTGATSVLNNGLSAAVNAKGERASSSQMLGGKMQFVATVSVPFLKELMQNETTNFDSTWKQLERGEYVSKPLKSTIKIYYECKFDDIVSYNIIGKIEGSDPKLKNEYVIHSGHLDHIGVSKPINGDSINNGAHDNASGIACSLEIARMYSNLKVKPKRSILFVFCTAEEMGLLGSGYFAKYPTVPAKNLVADVNMDMPTIIAPLESVAPLGAEHSSLWNVVEQAATALNLKIETDPDPSEGRFVRSDQYNFLKAGIPALHIKYGYKLSNPDLHLFEKVKIFRENHYHKPSDNVNDSFVWSAGRKYAQVNFLVSYLIAQNPTKPSWNKGDFFNPDIK